MYYVKLFEMGLPEVDSLVRVPVSADEKVQIWGFPSEEKERWKVGMRC
jgi:hypothetical protein